MTINNPLADNSPDHEDQNLVLRARSGDHQALEDLVQRHQTWIYNIAIRMLPTIRRMLRTPRKRSSSKYSPGSRRLRVGAAFAPGFTAS